MYVFRLISRRRIVETIKHFTSEIVNDVTLRNLNHIVKCGMCRSNYNNVGLFQIVYAWRFYEYEFERKYLCVYYSSKIIEVNRNRNLSLSSVVTLVSMAGISKY